jgi:hypothetical protein
MRDRAEIENDVANIISDGYPTVSNKLLSLAEAQLEVLLDIRDELGHLNSNVIDVETAVEKLHKQGS